MKPIIHFFFSGLCLMAINATALADIAVIASSGSSASNMTSKEIKKIFLGKSSAMTPVDQSEGNATRNAFYLKVAGKDESQMKAYWSKMIFSGNGAPPDTVSDDAAVKAWVVSNKNGIGYIDSGTVDGSVKVLLTVK